MPSFHIRNFAAASDKEELQIILKNASDAVHILDPNGNVVLFSDSFARLLGYTNNEVANLNVAQWDVHFSPRELQENMQKFLHGSGIFETQHRRKDGTIFDVEINVTGVEIRGELYLYASSRDISERKSMEAVLLHEKNFIDTIIESANHIIAVIDKEGRMVRLNRYGQEFTGYTQQEISSEPFFWKVLLPQEIRQKVYAIIEEAKNGNIIRRFENSWISKAGEEKNFDWSNALITAPDGSMEYLVTMGIDITDKITVQNSLRQSEENYRELFDGVKEIKLVIDAETMAILNANESASRFYGYPISRLCTMSISDINTLSNDEVKAEMEHAHAENRSHFYFKHRLSSGEIRDVEVHSGPVTYNGVSCLYSIIHDVTDRKKTERSLELERSRLNALVESIPDLVWLKDKDGIYLSCNSRFESFFGATHDEIVGKSDYDYVDKEQADFFRANDNKAMLSDGVSVNEEQITFASDGHKEWLETIKTAVRDQKGELIGVLGIGRDITLRKAHEEEIQLLASIFSTTHDGIMICDTNETIVDVNPAFTEIVGYTKDEILGLTPRVLSSGMQSSEFYATMWKSIEERGFWKGEVWNRNKNGEFYAVQTNISSLRDAAGNVTHYIGLFSDITSLKSHEEALDHLAHYDPLTNLPNRALLADRLEMALSHAQRKKSLLAVCFLDLDGFKPINDTFGHNAGDNLLIEISRRLKAETRADDTVARLGGDEFVILLNDLGYPRNLETTLKRFLMRIKQPYILSGNRLQVSASIGVALTSSAAEADILLRQADQAMYKAKQMGRDQFHVFDAVHDAAIEERHGNLNEIRKALDNREFELYYQPKVNMITGDVFSVEGLIRWNDPKKGVLSPAAFLPFLKGTELSVLIDYWVIEQAIKQSLAWTQQGYTLSISVNITGETLLHHRFLSNLHSLLQKYNKFQTKCLTFEVLETAMLEDIQQANIILNECLTMGFGLSLDDFGTGHSSLTYLRHLPVHNVKIDQSFVKDILNDEEALALVESVIGLSKVFKKEVIAEGVESEAVGNQLIRLGCTHAQGFAIAKPMPHDKLIEWLSSWKPYRSWISLPAA